MNANIDPVSARLIELRVRCREETERFFRRQDYDPGYCYEIFRRAILQQDQEAWESLFHQYTPLLVGWIERSQLYGKLGEETQYFVNRAFEKMWQVITPEKFSNFPDLKSILRYLQMCVHSVVVDYARAGERAALIDDEPLEVGLEPIQDNPSLEEGIVSKTLAEDLWAVLVTKCKTERERCILSGIFVYDLKPAELFKQNRDLFSNVQQVYRTKENLLTRFQRDDELSNLLGSR